MLVIVMGMWPRLAEESGVRIRIWFRGLVANAQPLSHVLNWPPLFCKWSDMRSFVSVSQPRVHCYLQPPVVTWPCLNSCRAVPVRSCVKVVPSYAGTGSTSQNPWLAERVVWRPATARYLSPIG
ncbi:unnamed protein product [Protopolystoma xenopodis]|uniref:Uncharacterized protein n=1 Tax=Protopolystoma xenopodis TaxID=117903 RepID=A0A448XEC7_9PLAT|nr:unnamed protein product [Protopolystoma xenopodis]